MKKTLIIVGAVLLFLALVGFWVYLMFFGGTTGNNPLFTDFSIGIGEQPETIIPETTTPALLPQVDTSGEALRQLTTRPVAGFQYIETAGLGLIKYAEVGTGHVYEINLATGEEARISGTTIPRVVEAVFSAEGTTVALVSESGYVQDVYVGDIVTDGDGAGFIDGVNLPPNARVAALSSTTVWYHSSDLDGTTVFAMDTNTLEQREVAIVPFSDVVITVTNDSVLVTNAATSEFEGALYQSNGGSLLPLTPSAYGFSAFINQKYFITTVLEEDRALSSAVNRSDDSTQPLSIVALPEKCDSDSFSNELIWCGAPIQDPPIETIENWYQGTTGLPDALWKTNLFSGESTLISNLSSEAGRIIDVIALQYAEGIDNAFFINKIDGTLWQYDNLAK